MHVGRELAAGNRDLTLKGLLEEEELTKKKKSGKRPKESAYQEAGALFLEGGSCQLLQSSLVEQAGWELELDIMSAV